jgi:hypothetical protein
MTDQYVGSNHDPSSQDVDSAWLTPEERNQHRPALSRRYIMRPDNEVLEWGEQKMLQIHDLLEHAALADELINELAAALHQQIGLHYQGWTDTGNAMSNAKNVLRRVDAIRKQ